MSSQEFLKVLKSSQEFLRVLRSYSKSVLQVSSIEFCLHPLWRPILLILEFLNVSKSSIFSKILPKYNQNTTEILSKCNWNTTIIQPKYNLNTTKIQLKYNYDITKIHPEYDQNPIKIHLEYDQNTIKIQPFVLNSYMFQIIFNKFWIWMVVIN